jgi:hypothetical protein
MNDEIEEVIKRKIAAEGGEPKWLLAWATTRVVELLEQIADSLERIKLRVEKGN